MKAIAIIIAIAGAAAGIYFAVKKFLARKECANCCEEFVPCECCDCEDCNPEATPAQEEAAAEDEAE